MPNTSEQAFPSTYQFREDEPVTVNEGMTLRDYFAAAALTGLMGDPGMRPSHESEFAHMATRLYQVADAMLAAREVQS